MKDMMPLKWKDETKQPALWTDQVDPHTNCGIPNQAFYLAVQDFYKKDGKPTWENVGQIWYSALTDPAFKKMEMQTFKGWKELTLKHAGMLFKADGKKVVDDAWKAVGI
jgi:Zn-dependent metalloprotease